MTYHSTGHFSSALGLLLTLVSFFSGCNTEPAGPVVPPVPQEEVAYDWFIDRLEHILVEATPSLSSGLRTKQEMTHQLNRPSDTESNYTATVTISTTTTYLTSPSASPKKKPKRNKSQANIDAFLENDPLDNTIENPNLDYSEFAPDDPHIVTKPVPMPQVETKEVFELIYRDGQWQLTQEPESENARNWFDYALMKTR